MPMPQDTLAKAEEFTASLKEIDAIAARLRSLLAEPLPDDDAWQVVVRQTAADLRQAMVETFEMPPEEHMDKALTFLCDSFERTFSRLSAWKDDGCRGDL